jgi:hypothetical protein
MPFFDDNPLHRLALRADEADDELDLRGLDASVALERIEKLLAESNATGRLLIRFDAALGDGRETLFLPLGRRLLDARREGRLKRCLPAEDGAAYFIEFDDVATTAR